MDDNFTFKELGICILKNFYIVIVFVICGGVVGIIYNNTRPVNVSYDTTASLYLKSEFKSYGSDNQIIHTYAELLHSQIVIETIIKKLNLDSNYEKIAKNLIITPVDGSNVINIYYNDLEEEMSKRFVEELYNSFIQDELELNVSNLLIINEATAEKKIISKKNSRYIVSGISLGFVLGITVVYALDMFYRRKNYKLN